MAVERGCWLRDQTWARFGACATVVGAGPPVTWGAVWVLAVVEVVGVVGVAGSAGVFADVGLNRDSNWRAVTANDRLERSRGSPWATVRSRAAYIVLCECGCRGSRSVARMEPGSSKRELRSVALLGSQLAWGSRAADCRLICWKGRHWQTDSCMRVVCATFRHGNPAWLLAFLV